jgi:hypothetical protein
MQGPAKAHRRSCKKILPRLAVMQGPAKAHRRSCQEDPAEVGRDAEKILPRLEEKILPRLAAMPKKILPRLKKIQE